MLSSPWRASRINGLRGEHPDRERASKDGEVAEEGDRYRKLDAQVAIEFDAQSGATSGPDLSDRVVGGHIPSRRARSAHWKDRRSLIVSKALRPV